MIHEQSVNDRTNGRWTREEHDKFMLGLKLYGKNWKKIEELIVTRNGSQIRSHAQKYFMKSKDRTSESQEGNENRVPEVSSGKQKEITICKRMKNYRIPTLNSPFFWAEMSQLISNSDFSFWELIQQSSAHEGSAKQRELSFIPCNAQETTILQQNKNIDNQQQTEPLALKQSIINY